MASVWPFPCNHQKPEGKPVETIQDHGRPIDDTGTRYVESEIPLYCENCHHQIPPHELACRRCWNTKQPQKKERYAVAKPDAPGGLFDNTPAIKL